jgi:hypothetical protein
MTTKALYPSTAPSLLLDFANVKQLDSRITFTRTTTATYYDNKTVAKAEENLLQRSQEFDNAYWTGSGNLTVEANSTTAPDGTSTAELLREVATTATHRITLASDITFRAAPYTVSCFLKKGTRDWARITLGTLGNGGTAYFNLDTGVLGTVANDGTGTGTSATITSVGNGWYRCVLITTPPAGAGLVFYGPASADNTTSYLGNVNEYIYIWGAQLEQRSSVTAYTPTTTQPITNYIPVLQTAAAGQARFDHNPVTGESLGLLIEEQRTNLVQRSQEFDDAYWTKTNSSITANTIVAPDGTISGDLIVQANGTSGTIGSQNINFTSGVTYTLSFYAKKQNYNYLLLAFASNAFPTSNRVGLFNLDTGAVATASQSGINATITAVGNGWYKCSITQTANATASTTIAVGPRPSDSLTGTGNGTDGIYIWGAQLEAGAFPTSYIPTVASQVTRNADAASMTGTNFSSWYRADEGTLYAEALTINTATSGGSAIDGFCGINDGSANNGIQFYKNGANNVTFEIGYSGTTAASIAKTIAAGSFAKVILAYKFNDISATINAATVGTDTSANIPVTNQFQIGNINGGTLYTLNGSIKKLAYYPSRLANAQLQSLTTV